MSAATIFKYKLDVTDRQELGMPEGARMLSVQVQDGVPCLWAMVNPDAMRARVTIRIHGTGHTVVRPEELEFIDTFQLCGGELIFHVFHERD